MYVVPHFTLQPCSVLLKEILGAHSPHGGQHERQAIYAEVEDVHGLIEIVDGGRDMAAAALPSPDRPFEGSDDPVGMPRTEASQGRGAETKVSSPELSEVPCAGSIVGSIPAVVDARADDVFSRPTLPSAGAKAVPSSHHQIRCICHCDQRPLDQLPCHEPTPSQAAGLFDKSASRRSSYSFAPKNARARSGTSWFGRTDIRCQRLNRRSSERGIPANSERRARLR